METTYTEKNAYSIHDLAGISGLSPYTLRYYEKIGLIGNVPRDPSGRRSYTPNHVKWIRFLLCFRDTGMSLDAIKEYFNLMKAGDHTAEERRQLLVDHRTKVVDHIKELEKNLEMINYKIDYYECIGKGLDPESE